MKNKSKIAEICPGYKRERLTVMYKCDYGISWWHCKCDCGNERDILASRIIKMKSCGCLDKENQKILSKYSIKHGMTNTRLYGIWCGIKNRCYNPNLEHYDRYGGRGIKMCDEWKNSFENFRDWAYSAGYDERLSGKERSIDRIDVNGDYEPNNCRWVSFKEQLRNRTDTLYIDCNGEKITIRQFCEENGITYIHFVVRALKRGSNADEIIKTWNYSHGNHPGYYSTEEAAQYYGVCCCTIKSWIDKGVLKGEKVGFSWYVPCGQEVKYIKKSTK